jgi:hypothetical protein
MHLRCGAGGGHEGGRQSFPVARAGRKCRHLQRTGHVRQGWKEQRHWGRGTGKSNEPVGWPAGRLAD